MEIQVGRLNAPEDVVHLEDVTSILRVGYIYNKKIIRLYYLAIDISVNIHTKLYIYAEMLRSYQCTCIWVKLKKKK